MRTATDHRSKSSNERGDAAEAGPSFHFVVFHNAPSGTLGKHNRSVGRLVCRVRHEFRHGHTQGDGQPFDVHERDIALATLDAAYVGPMQVGKLSEFLLRDPSLLTN